MNGGSTKTPKPDANENPWYRLTTLYGEPAWDDHELQVRNRVAWNRYTAEHLTDKARATLIEKGGHSVEVLPHRLIASWQPSQRDWPRRLAPFGDRTAGSARPRLGPPQ